MQQLSERIERNGCILQLTHMTGPDQPRVLGEIHHREDRSTTRMNMFLMFSSFVLRH